MAVSDDPPVQTFELQQMQSQRLRARVPPGRNDKWSQKPRTSRWFYLTTFERKEKVQAAPEDTSTQHLTLTLRSDSTSPLSLMASSHTHTGPLSRLAGMCADVSAAVTVPKMHV